MLWTLPDCFVLFVDFFLLLERTINLHYNSLAGHFRSPSLVRFVCSLSHFFELYAMHGCWTSIIESYIWLALVIVWLTMIISICIGYFFTRLVGHVHIIIISICDPPVKSPCWLYWTLEVACGFVLLQLWKWRTFPGQIVWIFVRDSCEINSFCLLKNCILYERWKWHQLVRFLHFERQEFPKNSHSVAVLCTMT